MNIIDPTKAHIEFQQQTPIQQALIQQTLHILARLGVPFNGLTSRRLERMAMAFLAIVDIKQQAEWTTLKDETNGRSLRTRDIIQHINSFLENIYQVVHTMIFVAKT